MQFIILETDPIVCMDLEGMLVGRYPDSSVVQGAALADLGAAIHGCGPDTVLFVRSTMINEDADLALVLTTAATRGSRIIILGPEKNVAFPALFVDLPFTTDMVFDAVGPQIQPDGDGTSGAAP